MEPYAFWDLIAQEAYNPASDQLKNKTYEVFTREDLKKRIWLFACNDACKELINLYSAKLNIAGILDNNESMWGKEFCGVTVFEPAKTIASLDTDTDAIVLMLRLNGDAVAKQITDIGFTNVYSLGVILSGIEPFRSFVDEINELKSKGELRDIVLMESMNDFDGNTGALYDYLIKKGSQHRFIWICKSEKSRLENKSDVECLVPNRSVDDLKEYIRLRAQAKWEIWECDPIRKVRDDQVNVFLQHYGMGYKQVAHLYSSPDYVDYVLTTTELVHRYESKSITYSETSSFIYGELPRNDVLGCDSWDELSKITSIKHGKTVVWAPTLRESRFYNRVDSDIEYPYGVSLIYTPEQMEALNDFLNDRDILLIIKIHPRQKINFKETEFSNVIYLDGLNSKNVHSYKLLTQTDAMITDYSSMVFDYMLLDRPCAWVLEDREHYKIEYLMDDPDEYMPGHKIYTMEDMIEFLSDVADGKDPYREERRNICNRCNPPFEGKGCEKLVEVLGL